VAESNYAARSRRDPAWREEQLAGAAERERRRRELDPEGVRAARREATRRTRARQGQSGLTFYELLQRIGGDRQTLALVLRDEVAAGRIDYHASSRRYSVNGGLDPELRAAFRPRGCPIRPALSSPRSGSTTSPTSNLRRSLVVVIILGCLVALAGCGTNGSAAGTCEESRPTTTNGTTT
jgi:hypothetical protein